MSKLTVIKPSSQNPYVIDPNNPIILRVACRAGVNRSAITRQYIKNNIHPHSVVFPQYGAYCGDYESGKIGNYQKITNDGFNEVFGVSKCINMQGIIFKQLGYGDVTEYNKGVILDEDHRQIYAKQIIKLFWSTKDSNVGYKNIFVLINEDKEIINLVKKRLEQMDEEVELIIMKIEDTIYKPVVEGILPNSKESYQYFLDIVKSLIVFG